MRMCCRPVTSEPGKGTYAARDGRKLGTYHLIPPLYLMVPYLPPPLGVSVCNVHLWPSLWGVPLSAAVPALVVVLQQYDLLSNSYYSGEQIGYFKLGYLRYLRTVGVEEGKGGITEIHGQSKNMSTGWTAQIRVILHVAIPFDAILISDPKADRAVITSHIH